MPEHHGKFISYLRVSTQKQGASGLGIEAQRQAVLDHLNGGNWTLAREYVEVESGKRTVNRPQLIAAMAHAKAIGATLLVAKLDRLSRNAHFLMGLSEAKVDFVACDMPFANILTIGVMALVAQEEAKAISTRTKGALAAAKARGVKLGNPNGARVLHLHGDGNGAGTAGGKRKADELAARVWPMIALLMEHGPMSRAMIARGLNAMGVERRTGITGTWDATAVRNLLARLPAG
jgi:DNA invertase Pin-like site-specific DNA recombinase